MKRLVGVAAAIVLAAPMSGAIAAETTVGTVVLVNTVECSFKLRSGAIFYDTDVEADGCAAIAAGDRVIITFDRNGDRNEIIKVQRYEERYAIGRIEEITPDRLVLTTGAEFDLTDLDTAPTAVVGDYVRIEFVATMDGRNVANVVTPANIAVDDSAD